MNTFHASVHAPAQAFLLRGTALAAALAAAAFLSSCGGGGGSGATLGAQFQRLGTLPGYVQSEASAISADGSTVAGSVSDSTGAQQAFRWSAAAGMQGLGRLNGGNRSTATGISADGSVVVGSGATSDDPPSASAAFRWTAAQGMQRITPVPGSNACAGSGVSGDGSVVAGTCLVANNVAFRWTQAGGTERFSQYGGGMSAASSASAISRDGLVIAGAGSPYLTGAMLWPATGSPVVLGKLQPDDTFASAGALSRDGAVAAGLSVDASGVSWIFRWTAARGMERIAATPGGISGSIAAALSGDGRVLVGWSITSGGESALIWDDVRGVRPLTQMLAQERGLQLAGWTLQRATGISDDGRTITGTGINPQGTPEAWVVRLD